MTEVAFLSACAGAGILFIIGCFALVFVTIVMLEYAMESLFLNKETHHETNVADDYHSVSRYITYPTN